MATAENAKIEYEVGQDFVDFTALTDQGGHKDFRSDDPLWSQRAGYEPAIRPNGVLTGLRVTPGTASDTVDVSAGTVNLNGAVESISASPGESVTREDGSPNTHETLSVTITAAKAISVVAGVGSTSFSATRGAAGGPPYILPDSVEIAQVWLSSATPAAVTADEIKMIDGTTRELALYPGWTVQGYNVESGVIGNAGITFHSELPLIHSEASPVSPVPKAVYASYYEPVFTEVPKSSDFVPPETSFTTGSKKIYGMTLGSASSSIDQGSFTAYLEDGISDGLLTLKGQRLMFRFYQSRYNSLPYILAQGVLGVSRQFPADNQITAACTISPETEGVEVTG